MYGAARADISDRGSGLYGGTNWGSVGPIGHGKGLYRPRRSDRRLAWTLKSFRRHPVYLYRELLMKYTGFCQNDFNVEGYRRPPRGGARPASSPPVQNLSPTLAAASYQPYRFKNGLNTHKKLGHFFPSETAAKRLEILNPFLLAISLNPGSSEVLNPERVQTLGAPCRSDRISGNLCSWGHPGSSPEILNNEIPRE